MIAYKTYSKCPPSIKDNSIPDELIWLLEEIADHLKEDYENLEYIVVSPIEYEAYLLSIETTITQFNNINNLKNQSILLDIKIKNILQDNQINGLALIVDFGKRNMLSGKTENQIDLIMEDLDIIKLCMALISGSYKYALRKVTQINNPAITQADKDYFTLKITELLARKY